MADNSPHHTKKYGTIALTITIGLFLIGLLVFQTIQQRHTDAVSAAKTPCLDTGKCMIGVSFSDDIPGFRVKNGKEYFGFDIDIANYLVQRLGRGAPVIVQADRDQSLTDRDKPVHMYISTVSMTDDRLDKMMFVGPYMRTYQGVMVKDDSGIMNLSDLAGKTVCVADDTTSEKALDNYAASHTITKHTEATTEQCIAKVKDASYDAVTGDYITLQTHAHRDPSLRPVANSRLSDGYELYGVAVPKDDMKLCQALKPFLKDFIREKWEPAYNSNLKALGITYEPTNTAIASLKPGESLIDTHSCKQKEG